VLFASFFKLGDKFAAGGIFHGENFPWGGKFQENEIFRGYFTPLGFVKIPIQNSSYVFLFGVSILRVKIFRVIVQDKISPGLNYLVDISVERCGFSVEMESDFLELFKATIGNKYKASFSNLE